MSETADEQQPQPGFYVVERRVFHVGSILNLLILDADHRRAAFARALELADQRQLDEIRAAGLPLKRRKPGPKPKRKPKPKGRK